MIFSRRSFSSVYVARKRLAASSALRDAIVGRVWETYANAFEHAKSPVGVFSCGQHFPRKHSLQLCVVDFGVGIPSNVRWFVQNPDLPADVALRWAFEAGNTTAPNGMGQGIGLDLLRELVNVNAGCLEVFSHEGYARIDDKGEKYETRGSVFEGTLLNVSLRCDDRYYCFQSEAPGGWLF